MLDAPQRRVVDHRGGRLLVLAGPGTGKTTTIVETVAARIESGDVALDEVLVLTFGRRAAESVRERVAARLDRVARAPYAMTFHSYAYSLLRRNALLTGTPVPQLLTGPEQLLVVRELFAGEIEAGLEQWPEPMRPLLRIRAFEREVRDLMMRALEHGLDGAGLARLGRANSRPEWVAIGGFLDRYLARFDVDLVLRMDYSELVRGAGDLFATSAAVAQMEWESRKLVVVDEYQDTDPAQERLLHGLVRAGAELVVVGDPDQSIYAFRGAEVEGILQFADRFGVPGDPPVEVVSLRTCHRFGPAIADAAAAVATRLPTVRVDEASVTGAMGRPEVRGHRDLIPRSDSAGQVDVRLCATTSAEIATIADELRRAHLQDGIAWSDMAVLVRSAVTQMSALQRGLTLAGVPVVVSGDEIALADELVVRALRLVVDATRDAQGPRTTPAMNAEIAEALLVGPFGGSDVMAVRRLRRALRDAELAADRERSSDELLVDVLLHPEALSDISPRHTAAAERVARVLTAAHAATADADAVLWAIWQASGRAGRWQSESLAGGEAGRIADRHLDAMVALFDACDRYTDRVGSRGELASFFAELAGQEIPGESMAERAPRGDAVRLLTAHRAKGLEWKVVVVAGVQEGVWPDLRLRRSFLGAEALADVVNDVEATPTMLASKALSDERRLFYVALTRAKERLLVTAVSSVDDADPLRPSRFIAALQSSDIDAPVVDAPRRRPLALPDVVVELRAVATDETQPEELRRAAALRLARLAEADVPGADPSGWWSCTPWSDDRPLVDQGADVWISPSAVESFDECALRWLLNRAVGLGSVTDSLQTGNLIHALAEIGERDGVDVNELKARLERVEATKPDTWINRQQAERAALMLDHFVAYEREARPLVGFEVDFEARVAREGAGDAVLHGRVDRLERDEQGRAFVADLKTGKSLVPKKDLDNHAQLGVYQLAVQLGGFAAQGLSESGGAALVQLGLKKLNVQDQVPLDEAVDPLWARELVLTVAAGMAGGEFAPTVNSRCRNCEVRTSCPAQAEGDGVVA